MADPLLVSFDEFADLLLPLGALNSPAELHGLLCGKLCGGAGITVEQWQVAAWEWLDIIETPDPDTHGQVDALYEFTQSQLAAGDYGLQPFLPDDDTDLDQRTQALSQWCHGFLGGFGSAGIDPNAEFSGDQAGALRDIAAIVHVDVDESLDDDQQEADYFELVEYVRLVAMSFYEDHKQSNDTTTNEPATPEALKNLH